MRSIDTFFDCELDYPDLDGQGAAERLSRAIQCKTINCADHSLTDYGPFDQLHALIRASYPHVMAAGTMEVLGQRSLLITLPGSDPGLRPRLFMSWISKIRCSAVWRRWNTFSLTDSPSAVRCIWPSATMKRR